ncbi:MAG TPA: hypothetical protein VF032_16650 [Thermoleophilaceae bacterium]
MAPGGPAAGFADAAAADGIELAPGSFDWFCEQGHVGLERVAKARRDPSIVEPVKAALSVLATIFARLGGDPAVLHAARENLLLPVQLVHEPSGTLIQLDELPHFTSFRLTALELYPPGATLGFDIHEHESLCRERAGEADAIGRGLAAKAFGFGGVQRERAYHDALLDLATPAMGHPPLIRIPVLDGDGAAAYSRFRSAAGGAALAGGRRSPPR